MFTANTLQVIGKSKIEFFLCKSMQVTMCTHPEYAEKNTKELFIKKTEKVGEKTIYTI